jgi:dolichol-phosphate mannosyltransferase
MMARPLTRVADPMAGFFALPRRLFQQSQPLDPIGYKIGLELIVKRSCRDMREVPITFGNRLHGTSKLTLAEQVNYLRHLKRLYVYKLGRLARPVLFGLVGLSGIGIDLLMLALLLALMPLAWARAGAIWAAMTWNFAINRRLTFSDAASGNLVVQYALFVLSCTLGAVVSWGTTMQLTSASPFLEKYALMAALPGILLGAAVNYTLCSWAVFRVPGLLRARTIPRKALSKSQC